jgi:hypothetical protein
MLPKTSTGIEIVGGTLRVAVVRSFLNRRRLLDSFEIPGFGTLSAAEQKQRLADLKKKRHISGSRVHLVLPHDVGIFRQIELPVEVQGKLSDVVSYQLEAVSPWPIDEVYWAYAKASPVKGSKALAVTIVVVPRDVVDRHVALFRSAGFPLLGATISAGAWAEGAATLWGGALRLFSSLAVKTTTSKAF